MWSRLLLLVLILLPARAFADAAEKIAALAPAALVLVVDADGKELVAQHADEPFVPASVTKIVTAWLALQTLGADYRFETRFYLDAKRVLYVRGGGDPFLISEELAILAEALVAAIGKEPITGIVLDGSYYPANLSIPGVEDSTRSFDTLNAALAVNFNTINAVRRGNKIESAEKQTPLTPLAISQFRARGPKGRGRISLNQEPALGLQYAGELLAAFIKKAGGRVTGKITRGAVPAGLKPIYVHRQSRPLVEILRELLHGSNNYVANQIFLEIGAKSPDARSPDAKNLGGPVSLEKSVAVARQALAAQGLADAIVLEEGSGLSRGNRFTARGLAKVLSLFAPQIGLLTSDKGASYKTGTLEGVRTLAGYVTSSSHGPVRFVIALKGNNGAMRFELLKAIEAGL